MEVGFLQGVSRTAPRRARRPGSTGRRPRVDHSSWRVRAPLVPRKWLILCRVAEISHCEICNSSTILEFKYVGDSGRDESGPPADPIEFRLKCEGVTMRYLKYLALVGVLMLPLAYPQPSHAQVAVGVGYGPPVCEWG